jgi:hypothetical protein
VNIGCASRRSCQQHHAIVVVADEPRSSRHSQRDAVASERDAIRAERDWLEVHNQRLEAILAEIRRAHFGRKSERITDDQLY